MIIDVHAHLDDKRFTNLDEVIKKAEKAGVKIIINCGIDHDTNVRTIKLSKKYPIIKPSLGLFPTIGEKLSKEELKKEILFIKKNKPIAIGEVGLDLAYDGDIKKQIVVFKEMIKLAKELSIPLIVHTRKAEKYVLEVLEEEKYKKVVLHCFMANKKLIEKAIELDFYFSIPVIIKKSSQFQLLTKMVRSSRLLTETDAPYLGLIKGEINTPDQIEISIKEIAKIKGWTTAETKKVIFMNYQRLFQ
jgi:TatD DNase family protein